jgi:hypothetical protein
MALETYLLTVRAEDQAMAGSNATALADILREVYGVVVRGREDQEILLQAHDEPAFNLGAGDHYPDATPAIALEIAAWLRPLRGVTLSVKKSIQARSLKAAVGRVDPDTAVRIEESIGDMSRMDMEVQERRKREEELERKAEEPRREAEKEQQRIDAGTLVHRVSGSLDPHGGAFLGDDDYALDTGELVCIFALPRPGLAGYTTNSQCI